MTPKQLQKVVRRIKRRGDPIANGGVDMLEAIHAVGVVMFPKRWPPMPKLCEFMQLHYPALGGENGAALPAGLNRADQSLWTRIHEANRSLVGAGILEASFDTSRIELSFDAPRPQRTTAPDPPIDDGTRAFASFMVRLYEDGVAGFYDPDTGEVFQVTERLGDERRHRQARERRQAAADERKQASVPAAYRVERVESDRFQDEGWSVSGPGWKHPFLPVFRTETEASVFAWELTE